MRSTLFGGLIASAGAATAFYFSSKLRPGKKEHPRRVTWDHHGTKVDRHDRKRGATPHEPDRT
jgi:hypothetical protein